MRTEEEILQRIKSVEHDDWIGTQRSDLIATLSFENAKQFLKEGVQESDWKPTPRDRESVISQMKDYMEFAWGKANNCRGLSAGRSLDHYTSWIWLAGDDLGSFSDYQFYGKDELARICKFYGWDSSQWDDGRRVNSESE